MLGQTDVHQVRNQNTRASGNADYELRHVGYSVMTRRRRRRTTTLRPRCLRIKKEKENEREEVSDLESGRRFIHDARKGEEGKKIPLPMID